MSTMPGCAGLGGVSRTLNRRFCAGMPGCAGSAIFIALRARAAVCAASPAQPGTKIPDFSAAGSPAAVIAMGRRASIHKDRTITHRVVAFPEASVLIGGPLA